MDGLVNAAAWTIVFGLAGLVLDHFVAERLGVDQTNRDALRRVWAALTCLVFLALLLQSLFSAPA